MIGESSDSSLSSTNTVIAKISREYHDYEGGKKKRQFSRRKFRKPGGRGNHNPDTLVTSAPGGVSEGGGSESVISTPIASVNSAPKRVLEVGGPELVVSTSERANSKGSKAKPRNGRNPKGQRNFRNYGDKKANPKRDNSNVIEGGRSEYNKSNRGNFMATKPKYSWRNEFSRLNKLYGANIIAEELLCDEDENDKPTEERKTMKDDDSFRKTSIKLSFTYQPSDPDFPFLKLSEYNMQESRTESSSPEKFPILIHITIPSGYPKENIEQVVFDTPEYQYVSSKFNEVFQECISKSSLSLSPIYEALKSFDRNLSELVLNGLPSVESINEFILLNWTPGEQKLLEEAICYYKYTKDVNKKWIEIANHVGNGKTVKQCIDRYKYCRSLVVNKQPERKPTMGEEHDEQYATNKLKADDELLYLEKAGNDTTPVGEFSKLNLTNFENLLINGLEIFSIDLIFIAILRLQIYCLRCNEVNDYKPISIPSNQDLSSNSQEGTKELTFLDNLVLGNSQNCKKCSLKHSIHFSPLICHSNDIRIGKIEFSECSLRDILPSDILVSCSNCSNFLKIREFFVGKQYSVNCRYCFKELKIKADSLILGDEIFNVDKSTDFLLAELNNMKKFKKKVKDSKLPTAVGTPLPSNGTCSHYKKSNRWNRFPCCNKAYPCHECHDKDNPDHKFEWAKQMICGFCSREQGFSESCRYCRANLTGKSGNASGRFWEGGKGCRNPLTLSSRDSRKRKLISRQLKKT
ncbi:zinc finger protein [Cryptosporidium sp. chipmunk genotype I]|uniref:zinc finger protein n=1 Tax=Cryptosporidium sp. chipmunk genotype I TaxID=1280935 RepID=UPI00351A2542|nr:zinc finger protein [Cryptosporidium sp. chipmunk genotype I]